MSHSKGGLTINEWDEIIAEDEILSVRGVSFPMAPGLRMDKAKANARRLVACWNYCEGVPTHELEMLPPNDDGLRGVYEMLARLEQERDEMLAALRRQYKADDALYAMPFDCDKDEHEAAMKEHYFSYKSISSILDKYKDE